MAGPRFDTSPPPNFGSGGPNWGKKQREKEIKKRANKAIHDVSKC